MSSKGWPKSNDIIFFYSKSDKFFFHQLYGEFSEAQLARYKPDENGRLCTGQDLTFSTVIPDRQFTWRGTTPSHNRSWGAPLEQLEEWWHQGLILVKKDGTPRLDGRKVFLDEKKGKPIDTNWTDILRVGNTAHERLGYPTQKPLALLERIILASSNEGDVCLDPFCGCGTAVHAAEKLNRKWIGIDVTHLAISLIEKRMHQAFPGIKFEVHGTPKDFDGAKDIADRDKYQFQWWACSLVGAQPYRGKRKGADSGIDGLIYFHEDYKTIGKIVVSVKGGNSVTVSMVRDLVGVVDREKAQIGLFVTLADKTKPMDVEATKAGFYTSPITGKSFPKIQVLTIKGLMNRTERPIYPDIGSGGLTFKQAKKDDASTTQKELFNTSGQRRRPEV